MAVEKGLDEGYRIEGIERVLDEQDLGAILASLVDITALGMSIEREAIIDNHREGQLPDQTPVQRLPSQE